MFAFALANGYLGDYGQGYHTQSYSHAYPTLHAPAKHVYTAPVNTGHSTQYRKQDSYGNYAFGYDAQSWDGGHSQNEKGDAWGNKEGTYSLNVGDGRQRVVKYVADGHGFRASIKTNEPGIVAKAPAAVSISTPHGHSAVPAPHGYESHSYGHAAPIAYAASYAAPAYGHAAPAYGHGYAGQALGYGSHY